MITTVRGAGRFVLSGSGALALLDIIKIAANNIASLRTIHHYSAAIRGLLLVLYVTSSKFQTLRNLVQHSQSVPESGTIGRFC
jgi:hypothetical protein